MPTSPATIDFLADQIGALPGFRTRRMFGEYAVYLGDKIIGFVCDDQLYVKPHPADAGLRERCPAAPPYPGAKDYWLVTPDRWEDADWLAETVLQAAEALPPPAPKRGRGGKKKAATPRG